MMPLASPDSATRCATSVFEQARGIVHMRPPRSNSDHSASSSSDCRVPVRMRSWMTEPKDTAYPLQLAKAPPPPHQPEPDRARFPELAVSFPSQGRSQESHAPLPIQRRPSAAGRAQGGKQPSFDDRCHCRPDSSSRVRSQPIATSPVSSEISGRAERSHFDGSELPRKSLLLEWSNALRAVPCLFTGAVVLPLGLLQVFKGGRP